MPPRGQTAGSDRLESWKEIAAYLGRVERTVRRWEAEEGLPVHRHLHARQGSVYAFKSELDAWRLQRSSIANSAEAPDASEVSDSPESQAASEAAESSRPREALGKRQRIFVVAALAVLVLVAVLSVTLLTGWRLPQRLWPLGAPKIQSIAVLPFQNFSGDPEQDFFSDGTTEALISSLAQIHALKVISRTTMMRYKATSKKLPEIGRELGVDAIVEGSVQRSGGRVRVTAQLIQVSNDTHIWAKGYDGDLSDVLKLESDVAQAIAQEIKIQVTPDEQRALASSHRVDPQAQDEYFLGRYFHLKANEDGSNKALEHLKNAIRLQPDYAAAWAELSGTLQDAGIPEYRDEWMRDAQKSVDLDPNLSEAHAALASAKWLNWDWSPAEAEFKRAIDLNPNTLDGCGCYALFLASEGRFEEANANIEHVISVNPMSNIAYMMYGFILTEQHRFQDAIARFQRALELEPDTYPARQYLALVNVKLGKPQEAVTILDREDFRSSPALALAYAAAGRRQDAERTLRAAVADPHPQAYAISIAYFQLGDNNQGFAWLTKSFDVKEEYCTMAKLDPLLDPVRSDPRMQKLVSRLHVPEHQ